MWLPTCVALELLICTATIGGLTNNHLSRSGQSIHTHTDAGVSNTAVLSQLSASHRYTQGVSVLMYRVTSSFSGPLASHSRHCLGLSLNFQTPGLTLHILTETTSTFNA